MIMVIFMLILPRLQRICHLKTETASFFYFGFSPDVADAQVAARDDVTEIPPIKEFGKAVDIGDDGGAVFVTAPLRRHQQCDSFLRSRPVRIAFRHCEQSIQRAFQLSGYRLSRKT